MSGKGRAPAWAIWLITLAAVGGALFSALGIDMVVALAGNPVSRQLKGAAYVYLIAFVVSSSVLIAAVITLIRRRRRDRDRSNDVSAAV